MKRALLPCGSLPRPPRGKGWGWGLTLFALAACRPDAVPAPPKPVDPPVASPEAIPDAPVSGTIRGAPFTAREVRYIVDRRLGYAHTDILLSSGKAETPCGPISPLTATSVWLRMEGMGKISAEDTRLGPDKKAPWTVHYQVFTGEEWVGMGDGSALLSLREPSPDGRLNGGLAVCFGDDPKSCVSGSFDAANCPPTIDQPVRGALPPETIPAKYLQKMSGSDAGPRTPDGGDAAP